MENQQVQEETVQEDFPVFEIGPGKILNSEKFGRYIVATRDIKEGEIICEDFPIMIAPKYEESLLWHYGITKGEVNNNNNTLKICQSCFKKCNHECERCHWPVCDFKCQKAYLHSNYECNIFREKKVEPMDFEFDFLGVEALRYILLRDRDPGAWRKFQMLSSNGEQRANDEKTKYARRYVTDFIQKRCGLDETEATVERVLGIMSTNGFSITFNYTRHSSLIFSNVSYLAHSCDPNLDVIWAFHPEPSSCYDQNYFSVKFYTVRDVKAGELLTHSYFLRPKPLEDRQRCMKLYYYFTCDCEKCRIDLFDELPILEDEGKLAKVDIELAKDEPAAAIEQDKEASDEIAPVEVEITWPVQNETENSSNEIEQAEIDIVPETVEEESGSGWQGWVWDVENEDEIEKSKPMFLKHSDEEINEQEENRKDEKYLQFCVTLQTVI